MQPDTLSVLLRSAGFIALFQAAGMAIFDATFGRGLAASRIPIERIARLSVLAALPLLLVHYALEAARMADSMSGIANPSLQSMVFHSASSAVLAARILGLMFLAGSLGRRTGAAMALSLIGSAVIGVSFALTGHTVASPLRLALAPLLVIHVTIVAFWFGALVPLFVASTRETPAGIGKATGDFSRVAGWLVPGILAAGLLLGSFLVHHLAEFRQVYGKLLIGKFCLFVVLMGLAALNKWRLSPAIASGDRRALHLFRLSLGVEYSLIAAVLSVTAVMTTFYSPEP